MRLIEILCLLAVLFLATTSQAAVKYYDSSAANGTQYDLVQVSVDLCPPVLPSPNYFAGWMKITDDSSGTVTLSEFERAGDNIFTFTPDQLVHIFGPGAFVFIEALGTRSLDTAATSNTSGLGVHGPSATTSGESAEWGVISGFSFTGSSFCVSSPTDICNQNGFQHGATILPVLPSTSYDLGTWAFDSIGDLAATQAMLFRTSNGGLTNFSENPKGAFVGSALPALPLIGFGALALSLGVMGVRSLIGRK